LALALRLSGLDLSFGLAADFSDLGHWLGHGLEVGLVIRPTVAMVKCVANLLPINESCTL